MRISGKRLIDRWAGLGKVPWPLLSDIKIILQSDTEFAGNNNHGLIGETHPRFHRTFVSDHQIDPLMPVQSDPVAGPVGKARQFVTGAKTLFFIYPSGSQIHLLTGDTESRRHEGRCLSLFGQAP